MRTINDFINERDVNCFQIKILLANPIFEQLWFFQWEAQFTTSNITTEQTKFNHIVGVIESNILDYVSDIVLNPPPNNQYKAIKERLIRQFEATDQQKLKSLLEELTLGDLRPSDLLRKMKVLSCNNNYSYNSRYEHCSIRRTFCFGR